MAGNRLSLINPANNVGVVAYGGILTGAPERVHLLSGEGCSAEWRIVNIMAPGPFNAYLSWSAGGAGSMSAQLSSTRGLRVCIAARTLQIEVEGLHTAAMDIAARVEEGFIQTRNVFEIRGYGTGAVVAHQVPPFAESFRYEAPAAAMAGSTITLNDAGGPVADYAGNAQLERNPVGAVTGIDVTCPLNQPYRLVFYLQL